MERSIDTAVIPVAGMGTRMWPFTAVEPKFMAGVAAGKEFRPYIDFALDDLLAAGIQHVVFVVSGNGADVLRSYLGPIPKRMIEQARALGKEDYLEKEAARRDVFKNMDIEYIEQGIGAYGTAIPLSLARNLLQGVGHFTVTAGDDFIWHPDGTSELVRQIASWRESGAANSIMGKTLAREEATKYGILDRDEQGNLRRIIEKPPLEQVPDDPLSNVSRYIFSQEIWPYLDEVLARPRPAEQPEYYITDVINNAAAGGQIFAVHPVQGMYLDTGSPEGILQAGQVISAHLLQ